MANRESLKYGLRDGGSSRFAVVANPKKKQKEETKTRRTGPAREAAGGRLSVRYLAGPFSPPKLTRFLLLASLLWFFVSLNRNSFVNPRVFGWCISSAWRQSSRPVAGWAFVEVHTIYTNTHTHTHTQIHPTCCCKIVPKSQLHPIYAR